MPLIKLYCDTGFANAKHEDEEYVEDEFWNSLTAEEKEKYLHEMGMDFMWNSGIECGAYLADEDNE